MTVLSPLPGDLTALKEARGSRGMNSIQSMTDGTRQVIFPPSHPGLFGEAVLPQASLQTAHQLGLVQSHGQHSDTVTHSHVPSLLPATVPPSLL